MTILVLDFWFGQTHKRLNECTINILSLKNKVLVTNYNDYYLKLENNNNVKLLDVKCSNKVGNKVYRRIEAVYNIIQSKKVAADYEYDAVLITGYEVISVIAAVIFFGTQKPILLQYHQHIDQVSRGLKKIIFCMYKRKVHHVILEEEYADYFSRITGLDNKRVHVVHHPLLGDVDNATTKSNSKLILGISSSNDEKLVENIYKSIVENGQKQDFSMHIRSKKYKYESEQLLIDNKFLNSDDYRELFDKANAILVIPPKGEFAHRVSGTIYDAIAAGKKVIGVDISIMRIMKRIAPSIFYIISEDNLMESLNRAVMSELEQSDLERLRIRHSNLNLSNEYSVVFESIGLGDKG